MRTIHEVIADVKRGESAVSLSMTALKYLAKPGVPQWLIDKILLESMKIDYTVKDIRSLIQQHRIPVKQRRVIDTSIMIKAGLCTVPDCKRKHHKNGYCKKHLDQINNEGCTHPIWDSDYRKIAEKALGKPLPKGAQVHHLDVDPTHNHPTNLVVCPDAAYHMLIERRGRAYKATGHADWLKCIYCKQYDDPKKLKVPRSRKNKNILRETWAYHSRCEAKNRAKYKK